MGTEAANRADVALTDATDKIFRQSIHIGEQIWKLFLQLEGQIVQDAHTVYQRLRTHKTHTQANNTRKYTSYCHMNKETKP